MDITVNTNDPIATGKRYATDSVRLIGKTGTAQYALAMVNTLVVTTTTFVLLQECFLKIIQSMLFM